MAKSRTWGVISTLVGASLWGFSGTCSQFLLENYAISCLFITMVRMLGAGAIFLAVILIRSRGELVEALRDKRARYRFAVFGALGLYACQVTYVILIGFTNAGTATVMQGLNIVIIMLVSCILARKAPNAREFVGMLLAFAAIVLIATQGKLTELALSPVTLFWGLATASAAAAYSMLPVPLYDKFSSFTVVGCGMCAGGIVAAIVWAAAFAFPSIDAVASAGSAMGSALVPTLDVIGVAALATVVVIGTFLAFFLFLNGLSIVGAVQGSQLGAIEPVSATVCSAVLVGTAFSAFDWVGLVLMVATILIISSKKA